MKLSGDILNKCILRNIFYTFFFSEFLINKICCCLICKMIREAKCKLNELIFLKKKKGSFGRGIRFWSQM